MNDMMLYLSNSTLGNVLLQFDFAAFFKNYPFVWGILIALFGVFFLLSAIYKWGIIFGDVNPGTRSLKKIDGIINVFGMKAARIYTGVFGVLFAIGGIVWVIVALFVL